MPVLLFLEKIRGNFERNAIHTIAICLVCSPSVTKYLTYTSVILRATISSWRSNIEPGFFLLAWLPLCISLPLALLTPVIVRTSVSIITANRLLTLLAHNKRIWGDRRCVRNSLGRHAGNC